MIERHILKILCFVAIIGPSYGQDWIDLYDSAGIYWEQDWKKSESYLTRALELAEKEIGRDDPDFAVLLNDLGLSHYYQGNLRAAQPLLTEAVELKQRLYGKNHQEYVLSAVNLAGLYLQEGRHAQAELLYLESLEFFNHNRDAFRVDYLQTLNDLGLLYENMGSFWRSLDYYNLVIQQLAGDADPVKLALAYNSIGRVKRKAGEWEEASNYLDSALRTIEQTGQLNSLSHAEVLNTQGNLYFSQGQYQEAESTLRKSIKIRREDSQDPLSYAESLNNLANLYLILGNADQAESLYLEALEAFRLNLAHDDPKLATVISNLGSFYEESMMPDRALEMYLEAARIYHDFYGDRHPLYANILNSIGSLYRSQGKFTEAEESYARSLEIYASSVGSTHPAYATTQSNLGLLYLYRGSIEQAKPLLEEAVEIQEELLGSNHPSLTASINNLGIAYFADNNLAGAHQQFSRVIQNQLVLVDHVFPALSEKEKEEFYDIFRDDIERFNTFAVAFSEEDPNILGEMYDLQLATKAILFHSTSTMRENIVRGGDPELIRQFQEWLGLREKLGFYYQLDQQAMARQKISISKLEERANELEKLISRKSQRFARENVRYSWRQIQEQLQPGEAAIEMVRFRKFEIRSDDQITDSSYLSYGFRDDIHYAALIITSETRDHPKVVLMKHGNTLENRYLSYYRNCIQFQLLDYFSYSMYWEALKNSLNGIDKIYLSPDGVYNLVNLSAILNPEEESYILDEMEILYLTSTKELLQTVEEPVEMTSGVFFANPDFTLGSKYDFLENHEITASDDAALVFSQQIIGLPGTVEEVEEIDRLTREFDWSNDVYMGEQALESTLKTVKNPRVLHIASHGFFSPQQIAPVDKAGVTVHNYLLQSGLLLAGAKGAIYEREQGIVNNSSSEDGIFTAYEAMNLRLESTDLVVLSACETGLGYVQNGEGIYGLQRSFKVAGANSIIISLWPVDDAATKQLIVAFYQEWLRSGDKYLAFRAAQEKLRRTYQQPFYWGAFILVGT